MNYTLTKEQFEVAFRAYMDANSFSFENWDIEWEWQHYARGKSFFIEIDKWVKNS